jgi:hypothetical protein
MTATDLHPSERWTLAYIALLVVAAVWLPPIHQPEAYHRFADQRMLFGIPHFFDVASNLVFVAAGALGLLRLGRGELRSRACAAHLAMFFAGLVLTGFGSALYHLRPDSQTLFLDRFPMVITFAGLIGTFLTLRVSRRMGDLGLVAALMTGGAGLALALVTGNLSLYVAVQFGGLAGILVGLLTTQRSRRWTPWYVLTGWYVLAKLFEAADQHIWQWSGQLMAGHTLKHLAAGMCGFILLKAFARD